MSQSGFSTYTEAKGANVTPETENKWADYVKNHPIAKQFKNKGWPLYKTMDEILPDIVKGANIFRASQTQNNDDNSDGNSSSGDESVPPQSPPYQPEGQRVATPVSRMGSQEVRAHVNGVYYVTESPTRTKRALLLLLLLHQSVVPLSP